VGAFTARVVGLVAVIAWATLVSGCGTSQRSFNSADWKANRRRAEMGQDLRARYLKVGTAKSSLYPILGWPEEVSGSDYDYSRRWSWCIKTEEQDAFMSHAPCVSRLDIFFAAPTFNRIRAVRVLRIPM
jgi:hypothetical protein